MLQRNRTHLHTLALWQTNPWLLLSNDKHIAFSSSKRVVNCILDVHDIEASIMTFPMRDNTHTTHVTPTGDHGNGSGVKLDEVGDLAGGQVDLDSVIDFDDWIWVSNPILISLSSVFIPSVMFFSNQTLVQRLIDEPRHLRASIMRNQEWDSPFAQLNSLDLPKFVFCLGSLDSVHGKAAFGIVDESEVLAGLFDCDHVHETSRVGGVGSNFAINFDESLHEDGFRLAAIEGVLEPVSNEDNQW
jgi:hypothetical protein